MTSSRRRTATEADRRMSSITRPESEITISAAPEAQSIAEVVDPEIEALPMEGRAKLAAIWQKRGGLELRVAAGFSALAVELFLLEQHVHACAQARSSMRSLKRARW